MLHIAACPRSTALAPSFHYHQGELAAAVERILPTGQAHPRDPAIAAAISLLDHGVSVAEARSRVGLLPKTFVRRFREQVGLAPKRLARVRRLQRIVSSVRRPVGVDWSMVAADHGYTDQAHFIHDFRDLTGMTPTAYRPPSPHRRNHVPLAAPDAACLQYRSTSRPVS